MGAPTPRQTGRLTVGRIFTSTSTPTLTSNSVILFKVMFRFVATDGQSTSMTWCQAKYQICITIRVANLSMWGALSDHRTCRSHNQQYMSILCHEFQQLFCMLVGRLNWCWPSSAQLFLASVSLRSMTKFLHVCSFRNGPFLRQTTVDLSKWEPSLLHRSFGTSTFGLS
jgi:hypothetical protein